LFLPIWSPISIVVAYGSIVSGTGVTIRAQLNVLSGSGSVASYGWVWIIASGRIVTPNV
jgi:hypothetical protein